MCTVSNTLDSRALQGVLRYMRIMRLNAYGRPGKSK